MKVRDSGMPDECMWSGFFDPDFILRAFGLDQGIGDVVEFGCGYGTFTLAAARLVAGTVYAQDIEQEMVAAVQEKSRHARIKNIRASVRDFVGQGTGFADNSIDAALQFNILHHEQPIALMAESWRILKPGGVLAVIHWNHDPSTPRGPVLEIRPRPEECIAWGKAAGFGFDERNRFDFPPYHYGLLFQR
ncbi:class I SAM-dependent methyltransferase [Oryzomonas sagensis]|uniref:Class I SAM-dependent methyltransferase n=1 Tax=Oryzomonas sagensis TaxID=2603857 RepID=A0ABQ6TP22_9BACT|nr:class I SAM-dependent methyltransferase [Oryzomonas sagensis]KAB0670407.1 class I SAM-dependent methyltransferase [Oryzomonas sagensis]